MRESEKEESFFSGQFMTLFIGGCCSHSQTSMASDGKISVGEFAFNENPQHSGARLQLNRDLL